MGHLMGSIGVVSNVLVLHLGKEIWELLIQGTTGVEAGDSNRLTPLVAHKGWGSWPIAREENMLTDNRSQLGFLGWLRFW